MLHTVILPASQSQQEHSEQAMPHLISLTSSPIAISETIRLKTNIIGIILSDNRSKHFTSSCPITQFMSGKETTGFQEISGAQCRAEYHMQINGNSVTIRNKVLQC